MIITTSEGKSFDTQNDLTAAERHILQKLLFWESMASTLEEFDRKREVALEKGWNLSGPVDESPSLKCIVTELRRRLTLRLGVCQTSRS
jgi:hypothetical protein